MIYSGDELVILARAYMEATGMSATKLGLLSAGNNRFIYRLVAGDDCRTQAAGRLSDWLDANWGTVPWPEAVRRRKRQRRSSVAA